MVNDRVTDITVTNTNSLWVCTYGSGFLYYNGVSLWVQKNMSTTGNLMPTNYTYCLALDNSSNIYVGIYNGNPSNAGLVKWDGANTWTTFNNFFNGYNYSNVEAIVKDNSGISGVEQILAYLNTMGQLGHLTQKKTQVAGCVEIGSDQ